MQVIVLAATFERGRSAHGADVPAPLMDLGGEPYLSVLVKKVAPLPGLSSVCVVTNEALKPALAAWAAALPAPPVPVRVLGDGTHTPEGRLGAVGDLLVGVRSLPAPDDVLVIGGENWFAYDVTEFLRRSADHSPSVVLTKLPRTTDASRFGQAELGAGDRVTRFLEKPRDVRLPYRAGCVYYFSRADLPLLERFSAENPTRCTPGTLMSWLAARGALYGVPQVPVWFNSSGQARVEVRGPDTLLFRTALLGAVDASSESWKRVAARQMEWVSSPEDLLELLGQGDPDQRIMAATLLGYSADLLSPEGREAVVAGLLALLADPEMNQYDYGASQSDESDVVFVADAAAAALVGLGYAASPEDVFRTARAAGWPVVEGRVD